MVAELDRVRDAARLQPQPALLRHAYDHGTVGLEHEHGAVEQMLIARQGDCDFSTPLRRRSKAMPGNIGGGDGQKIDRALMFQFVNSLGKRRIKAAAEHLLDPQHRDSP
jgi:hypothetical protein